MGLSLSSFNICSSKELINYTMDQNTLLLQSILFEDLQSAHTAILNDADIDKRNPLDRRTMLHTAVANNNIGMTKLLVQLGANKSLQDNNGHTPFHLAIGRDDGTYVSALIEALQSLPLHQADNV
jgi:ankyrin repeat protein